MKTIRKITQCILIGLTALMVQTAYAQKQVSDRALNCDSTCITPDSRTNTLPKANTSTAPTATAPRTPNPSCGPAAGTALPGAPSSFLCSIGTASAVSSSTADGETSYKWTCSNSVGSIACMADQKRGWHLWLRQRKDSPQHLLTCVQQELPLAMPFLVLSTHGCAKATTALQPHALPLEDPYARWLKQESHAALQSLAGRQLTTTPFGNVDMSLTPIAVPQFMADIAAP